MGRIGRVGNDWEELINCYLPMKRVGPRASTFKGNEASKNLVLVVPIRNPLMSTIL